MDPQTIVSSSPLWLLETLENIGISFIPIPFCTLKWNKDFFLERSLPWTFNLNGAALRSFQHSTNLGCYYLWLLEWTWLEFNFGRGSNDWELSSVFLLLLQLQRCILLASRTDFLLCKGDSKGRLTVRGCYQYLSNSSASIPDWPWKCIWIKQSPFEGGVFHMTGGSWRASGRNELLESLKAIWICN